MKTTTAFFNPLVKYEELKAASRLNNATEPKLRDLKARIKEFLKALAFLNLQTEYVDKDYVFNQNYGGATLTFLLRHTSLRRKAESFVAGIEQSLVPTEYLRIFERSVLAALVSPRFVAANRVVIMMIPFHEEIKNFVANTDDDFGDEVGLMAAAMIGKSGESITISPIVRGDIGYSNEPIVVDIYNVMSFGYYIGLMLSIARSTRMSEEAIQATNRLGDIPAFLGEEVFKYDFDRMGKYLENIMQEVMDTVVNDEDFIDTIQEGSYTVRVREMLTAANNVYSYAMHESDKSFGNSLRRIRKVLQVADDVVDEALAKFNPQQPVTAKVKDDGLTRAMKNVENAMRDLHNDKREEIVALAKTLAETKPSLSSKDAAAFKEPLPEEMRKLPWFTKAVKELAKSSFDGNEVAAEQMLTVQYNKAMSKLHQVTKDKNVKELLDVVKQIDSASFHEPAKAKA